MKPSAPDRNARLLQFAANMEKRRRSGGTSSNPSAAMSTLRNKLEKLTAADADSFLSEQLAPAPADDSLATSETLRIAEETAALCGRFAPADLIAALHLEPGDTGQIILNRLAPLCSVDTENEKTVWNLRSDRRSVVLQRLVSESRLSQALTQPLPATDLPGRLLQRVLRGEPIAPEDLDHQSLLALAWALEALTHVNLPKPDLAQVRQLLNTAAFLKDNDILLERGFFGRKPELARLVSFLANPGAGLQMLILTGLGGAGKSTLIARFVRDVLSAHTATVALLDFDRPGIDAQDTVSLEMEMTRQVGVQFPEHDQMLRTSREDVRKNVAAQLEYGRDRSSASGLEEVRGSHYQLMDVVARVIRSKPDLPLLLVLDTFEEATQRDLAPRLLEWLLNVASTLNGVPLRVIVSGRIFERSTGMFRDYPVSRIELGEFSPEVAGAYLNAIGISSSIAVRLAHSDVLPRRPLELKLLARLIASNPALSIEEIEAELRAGGKAAQDLFAGLVYRRVLQRISVIDDGRENFGLTDEVLRQIAYPGLILRYVNAQLIQEILVPALNLPAFTEQKANRALDLLTRHEWLSFVQGGNVWHRRDLRRSVLKPMIAEDPERAERIISRALYHFRSAPTESERAESVYHGLLLTSPKGNLAELTLEVVDKAATYFEADRMDLPPSGLAILTLAQTGEIAIDDIPLLPSAFRGAIYNSKGESLVQAREFGTALRLYRPSRGPLEQWERTLLCAVGEWDALKTRPLPKTGRWSDLGPILLGAALTQSIDLEQTATLLSAFKLDNWPSYSNPSKLESLFVGIVFIASGEPLPFEIWTTLNRAVIPVSQTDRDPRQSWRKKLVMLELALKSTPPDRIPINPSTICLDPNWLNAAPDNFKKISADSIDANLFTSVRDAVTGVGSSLPTSKWLLNYVQHLKSADSASLNWPHVDRNSLWWYLQNTNSEFRDPTRFALLEAFPDAASYPALAQIFQAAIPFPLADLNTTSFVAVVSPDPEHALESWVELADRSGVLEILLEKAAAVRPQAKKLRDVLAALQRWRTAVHTTVLSFPSTNKN